MAELTAQDIKVWNGSTWVTGFNIHDGANWQNINDGKVNIRGGNENWYKKNSIIATISPITNGFTGGKYHLDAQGTNWNTLRTSTNANYNSFFSAWSGVDHSYYQLARGIIRFDFTNISVFSINNAKLELSISSGYSFSQKFSLYLFNNNSTPTTTDFSNFGDRYSEIAGCIFAANTMEITFNSTGITALQNAINTQSIITFMIRTEQDTENIVPTTINPTSEMSYLDSQLILLK